MLRNDLRLRRAVYMPGRNEDLTLKLQVWELRDSLRGEGGVHHAFETFALSPVSVK